MVACELGTMLDPRSGCSECRKQNELYGEIYPIWVTPNDISLAEFDGLAMQFNRERDQPVEPCPIRCNADEYYLDEEACECVKKQTLIRPEHWPQCPANSEECDFSQWHNELTCSCFSLLSCKIGCPEKQDPIGGCQCITEEEYLGIFPEWSKPKDIDYSFRL